VGRVVGVGVVGLGRIGIVHSEIFALRVENAKLVAVCNRKESTARSIGEKFGARWYTSYEEMLKDKDLDAVVICTPTFLHADMIVRAAEEGKHILTEKPMTITVEEAKRVLKAVEKAGVKLQVAYMRRFDHAYSKAKKTIEEGKIGKPLLFIGIARDPAPPPGWAADPKKSGGIFLDMLSHDFDTARWLMSAEVTEVYVRGGAYLYDEIREKGDLDVVSISFSFSNGAMGYIHGSRKSTYGYDLRTEVYGSEGTVFVGCNADPLFSTGTREGIVYSGFAWFAGRFYDAYVAEDQHFIECILEDKKPLIDGTDGLRAVQIAEAAWKSIKEEKPIKIEY